MSVNFLAVLVAAIAGMALGAIWYGPLFGKQWMKLSGMTQEKIEEAKKKGMAKEYFFNFIAALVMAYVLAGLVVMANAATFGAGASIGFLAWLGFVAPVLLGGTLWEGKPVNLWILNIAYYLVEIAVMGGILAIWG